MQKKIITGVIVGCVVLSILIAFGLGSSDRGSGTSQSGGRVAVVYVEGVMSNGQGGGMFGGGASGETVAADLRRAGENPAIKAVVIRLESPGGSPAAAQEICAEIARLQEAGIVVVASMGDMAASGAYWVAACADTIIANPGTITGSIGVITEIINLQALYEKLGVNTETFTSGAYKDMGSSSRPITSDEREILQMLNDDIYEQFVEVVAQGRQMDVVKARELADGRIFTGRQALELGLIDHLGGLRDAVVLAGDLAGIKGEPVSVNYGRNNFWGSFMGVSAKDLLLGRNMVFYYPDMHENSFNIR